MKTGCQPPWRLFSVEGLPICQNITMLDKYTAILMNVTYNMDSEDIYQATNCLMPCTFMEYKVRSTEGMLYLYLRKSKL